MAIEHTIAKLLKTIDSNPDIVRQSEESLLQSRHLGSRIGIGVLARKRRLKNSWPELPELLWSIHFSTSYNTVRGRTASRTLLPKSPHDGAESRRRKMRKSPGSGAYRCLAYEVRHKLHFD